MDDPAALWRPIIHRSVDRVVGGCLLVNVCLCVHVRAHVACVPMLPYVHTFAHSHTRTTSGCACKHHTDEAHTFLEAPRRHPLSASLPRHVPTESSRGLAVFCNISRVQSSPRTAPRPRLGTPGSFATCLCGRESGGYAGGGRRAACVRACVCIQTRFNM